MFSDIYNPTMTALFVMLHNEPYRNSQLSHVTALAPVTQGILIVIQCVQKFV